VGTTWKTRGRETAKTVRTRIDRWLVSQVLEDQGRIGEVKIDKTRTSDHDAVICQLRVKFHKKKRSFERISARVVENEEFGKTVKTIFEEMQKGEGGDLLERHETFKERCKQAGLEIMKKWKKKRKGDSSKRKKKIKLMRRIVEWAEDARIRNERGQSIKRWERGNRMVREARG
jgi:hypothetical protein